jgi:exodeoxyribonuclease-3
MKRILSITRLTRSARLAILAALTCLLAGAGAPLNAQTAPAQTMKIIEYNIRNGMQYDRWQDCAGFVNWVRLQDPDILVLCEGRSLYTSDGKKIPAAEQALPGGIASYAAQWGHPYTAVSEDDGPYPVLVTSRYPLEIVQQLSNKALYTHGGLHLRVAGLNLVAFQGLEPETKIKELPVCKPGEETRRVAEMAALAAQTVGNPAYADGKNWILTGSLGGQSYADSLFYAMRHTLARFDAMRVAAASWPHDIVAERLEHAAPGGLSDYGLTTAGKPNRRIEASLSYGRGRPDYFLCDDAVEALVGSVRMIRDPFTFAASDHLPLEVVLRLPEGVEAAEPASTSPAPQPVGYAGTGEVPPGCLKMIDYNILYGMVNDQANHYDNFVAWVREQAPDILTLCEGRSDYYDDGVRNKSFQPAYLPDSLAVLARRWGHEYVFVGAYQDDHPVLITSKYPITPVQRLEGPEYKHGGLHVQVCGIDVVATHTTPKNDKSPDGKSGPDYRREELRNAVEQTMLNPAYRKEKYWVLTGDLNSVSRADAEYYKRLGVRRSYIEQDYLREVFAHDVVYDRNGGQTQPSVRHGLYRIDFLYANEALYRRVVSARTIVDAFTDQYSDHLPVEMVFKAPKGFHP